MARKSKIVQTPEVEALTDDGKVETFKKAVEYFQSDEVNSGKLTVEQAVEAAAEKYPESHKVWGKAESRA